MYHGLDSPQDPSELKLPGDLLYVVDIGNFKKQMTYIRDKEVPAILLQEDYNTEKLHEKPCFNQNASIMITFDDGHITNYTKAFPILKQFGLPAYFFITTDWINSQFYMNEHMIKTLYSSGMIIGSHGKSHNFFTELKDKELIEEIRDSKLHLEDILGAPVESLSVPGGCMDERTIEFASEYGYRFIFNSEPKVNPLCTSPMVLGRFPVTRNMKLKDFKNVINGNKYFAITCKHKLLRSIRHVIGNANYIKTRNLIMSIKYLCLKKFWNKINNHEEK